MEPNDLDPDKWKKVRSYDSKKNSVFKVEYQGENYVVKRYSPEFIEGREVEEKILRECRKNDIRAPEIIGSGEKTLILEYINGSDCKALFDTGEKELEEKILSDIARWLSEFHRTFDFDRRRGDSILANFIMTEEGVYGVDFEEARGGDFLRDVGDMCTSVLRLRPSFTAERFSRVEYFLDEYFSEVPKNDAEVTDRIVESLLHYSRYSSERALMQKWAKKIRENGLPGISRR